MKKSYQYNGLSNLNCSELFIWIVIDETQQQLGVEDILTILAILSGQPIIPTRAKPTGATKNTSIASVTSRRLLNHEMKYRLPTFTNASLRTLRPAMTKNLGAFVGRTVPVVGWIILTYDVVQIFQKSIRKYNDIAQKEDKIF